MILIFLILSLHLLDVLPARFRHRTAFRCKGQKPRLWSRRRRQPPRCLHHFVRYSAKEEGIGLPEVLDRVTMQVFVREYCTMIAAPVQCDVDGIPKGSHYVSVPPINVSLDVFS